MQAGMPTPINPRLDLRARMDLNFCGAGAAVAVHAEADSASVEASAMIDPVGRVSISFQDDIRKVSPDRIARELEKKWREMLDARKIKIRFPGKKRKKGSGPGEKGPQITQSPSKPGDPKEPGTDPGEKPGTGETPGTRPLLAGQVKREQQSERLLQRS